VPRIMSNDISHARADKWTESDLRLLLSLYYLLPFSAGDDESDINEELARLLKRSRSAIDRQWRNVDDLVRRNGAGNISQLLRDLVEETRDDPTIAVRYGVPLLSGSKRIAAIAAKETTNLVSSVIPNSTSSLDFLSPDSFLVLLRIIWVSPGFALSENQYFNESRTEIVEKLRLSIGDPLDLFKVIYCLRCRCLSSSDQLLGAAYKRFYDSLSLSPAEIRERVTSSCAFNRWHVWTYI